MRNVFIAAIAVFCMVACEDTSTTTETTEEEKGTQFTGASDGTDVTGTTEQNTVNPTETTETTEPTGTTVTPTETDDPVEEGNEATTDPGEETNTEEEVEEETTNLDDEVSLEDLTTQDLADIEILRESIFEGLEVGRDLYLNQVGLALQDLGLVDNYQFLFDDEQAMAEVSTCPYAEFYGNPQETNQFACEFLVDQARSDAYSKLYAALVTNREGFDTDSSEQDFWYEQGAISGLEESRVRIRMDMKTKQICNKEPTVVQSSVEKGLIVGRQHFADTMNNWLTTNGYTGDYPVMSAPVEVCQADVSMLDPVLDETLNSISQALEANPLCPDYSPLNGDDELQYAQAQSDYSASLAMGANDEFALAAVKIFKVVPCNVSDPIIVDLNNNGRFDITTVERGVNFSMLGKRKTATSWLSGDGFLFYDQNRNGIADDGTEFFGTSTEYKSGFAHLSIMDTDGDGTVSIKDKDFQSLYIWSDTNYDGISTKGEVTSIMKTNITSIPLADTQYQKASSVNGNRVKSTVKVSTGKSQVILFGDVDLRSALYPKLQK
jgi:hypothetical protein